MRAAGLDCPPDGLQQRSMGRRHGHDVTSVKSLLGVHMKSAWAKTICRLLIALMIWTPYQIVQAGMIGTDQVATTSSQADRSAVLSFVSRADVAGQLQVLGLAAAPPKDPRAPMTHREASYLPGPLQPPPPGSRP